MADTRFVLVATPRTGSTLLGDMLNSHKDIFCDNELFNPHQICRYGFNETAIRGLRYRNAQPLRFWKEFFFSEFAGRQKSIGFNFMLGHNYEILDRIFEDKDLKIIFLSRENKLAQYSSFQIALSTQSWSRREGVPDSRDNKRLLRFDFRQFEQWLQGEMTYEYLFLRMLETLERKHIRLEYQRILQQDSHELICEHLDVEPMPLKTVLAKQNENRVTDRFENPDDVSSYLELIGKEHWGLAEI